jgi:hypothetical protein
MSEAGQLEACSSFLGMEFALVPQSIPPEGAGVLGSSGPMVVAEILLEAVELEVPDSCFAGVSPENAVARALLAALLFDRTVNEG